MNKIKKLNLLLVPYELGPSYKAIFQERGLRSGNFISFVKDYKKNHNTSPTIKSRSVFALALKETKDMDQYLRNKDTEGYFRAVKYEKKLRVLLVEHYIYTYFKNNNFRITRNPDKDIAAHSQRKKNESKKEAKEKGLYNSLDDDKLLHYNIQGIDTYIGFVWDLFHVYDFTKMIQEIAIKYQSIKISVARINYAVNHFPLIDIIYTEINNQQIPKYFKSKLRYPGKWKIASIDVEREFETMVEDVKCIELTEFADYFFTSTALVFNSTDIPYIEDAEKESQIQARIEHDRVNREIDYELALNNQAIPHQSSHYDSGDTEADNIFGAIKDLDNLIDQAEEYQINDEENLDEDYNNEEEYDYDEEYINRNKPLHILEAMNSLSTIEEMKIENLMELAFPKDQTLLNFLIIQVQNKIKNDQEKLIYTEYKNHEERVIANVMSNIIEGANSNLQQVILHVLMKKKSY